MEAGITFFGAVDRKDHRADGIILSTEPAWSLDYQVDNIKEEVHQLEGRIRRVEVPSSEM
mgnify:CR=1 FL=1